MSHICQRVLYRTGVRGIQTSSRKVAAAKNQNQLFIKLKRGYQTNAQSAPKVWQTIRSHPNNGLKYLGMAGALGLGATVAWNLSRPAAYVPYDTRALMDTMGGASFASTVRGRIMKTYGYLTTGLLLTGATSFLLFTRGYAFRILNMNPFAFGIGSLVVTMGALMTTRSIDGSKNPVGKHMAWIATNACLGLTLCTTGLYGGAIVQQAALITGMIVGSMSLVAMSAPNDTFLRMGPYLGVGLGVVIAASLGGMFFPASNLLFNVSLYGGLGLFGLYTAHDAQRVLHDAQTFPHFDPIDEQMGLYMDTINIFVRIVQILAMQQKRR